MAMRRVVPTRSRAGTLAVGVLATLGVLTGLCGFVPSIALATDLSTDSCTAQDVTLGNGFILNEPCVCSPGGTFAAMVQFTVTNNASASRYCISDGSKTSATSHDFTVTVTKDTTYTLTVTDSLGCTRTATTSLNASPIAAPTLAAGTPDCPGKTTLTASPSGLASYTWFDGTTQIGTGNPLTVTLAPGDHSSAVKVTSSAGCSNTSGPTAVTVSRCAFGEALPGPDAAD